MPERDKIFVQDRRFPLAVGLQSTRTLLCGCSTGLLCCALGQCKSGSVTTCTGFINVMLNMIKPSNSSLILFHVIANCLSRTTTEQTCTFASLSCTSRSGSTRMIHCLGSAWTLLPAQHLPMQQQCQDPDPAPLTVFSPRKPCVHQAEAPGHGRVLRQANTLFTGSSSESPEL